MTTGTPKRERRRHPRAITNFSGVLTVGALAFPARIVNLSLGGALLNLGQAKPEPAIDVGDRLVLEIRCKGGAGPLAVALAQAGLARRRRPAGELKDPSRAPRVLFRVEGKAVLWNRSRGPVPLLAVQFDEVSDDDAEILEELMFEALSSLQERHVVVGSR